MPSIGDDGNGHSAPLAVTAQRYIGNHLADRLTTKQIAAGIGCSERSLYRAVSACLGRSVHQLVGDMRIARAKELLAQGMKVEAVALEVGYRGRANFYRAFVVRVRVTPGRLRSPEAR